MSEAITLEQLIAQLKACEPKEDKTICFDFGGFAPTEFASYRGDYSELAIGYSLDRRKEVSLKDFIALAEKQPYKTYEGYKGGSFMMKPTTPVFVDNWGEWSQCAVIGVIDAGYKVVISTGYEGS